MPVTGYTIVVSRTGCVFASVHQSGVIHIVTRDYGEAAETAGPRMWDIQGCS